MSEEKELELRSEDVTEILTAAPKWIFRWGIFVVFILIVSAISLSYFIRYPDILTSKIVLTTLNPPIDLLAKTEGKLTHLLVKNGETVHANQTIAVIENTANFNDVLDLFNKCNSSIEQLKLSDTIVEISIKDSLMVGEITPSYLMVLKTIKEGNLYRVINPYYKQINLLKKDLLSYSGLLAKYKTQENINTEQLKLTETDFNRDEKLYQEKAISARELETKKKEYLTALSSNEQIKITISSAMIQVNSIEKSILQLQIQDYQEQAKIKSELQQNLKSLVSEIYKWKQTYLIESPIEGKISFFNVWSVNQIVKTGDCLFSVIPSKQQEFIGKCTLPIANTGKLQLGQKVNIKVDNYPYNENGMLQGEVTNISEVPNKDNYMVDVKLKNGLITSYNKTLIYKEQMSGSADIITINLSVMDRVFFNFNKLIDRK